jgi:galactokinase
MQVANTPVRLLVAFSEAYPDTTPSLILQAPGRDLWLAVMQFPPKPYQLNTYHLRSLDFGGRAAVNYQSIKTRRTVYQRSLPWWAHYPAGVIKLLSEQGMDAPPLDILFVTEEPRGPGLDYALGIGIGALWHELHNLDCTPQQLIELVDQVRREYIEVE